MLMQKRIKTANTTKNQFSNNNKTTSETAKKLLQARSTWATRQMKRESATETEIIAELWFLLLFWRHNNTIHPLHVIKKIISFFPLFLVRFVCIDAYRIEWNERNNEYCNSFALPSVEFFFIVFYLSQSKKNWRRRAGKKRAKTNKNSI